MEFLAGEGVATRYNITFMGAMHSVLDEMSDDTELFEKLFKSYPRRMAAVKAEKGGHTEY